jgi:hypothetical protein
MVSELTETKEEYNQRMITVQKDSAEWEKFSRTEAKLFTFKKSQQEEPKKNVPVLKYSGHGKLAEAVIIANVPCFLQIDEEAKIIERVEEPDRILIPVGKGGYPHEPYSFDSIDEVNTLLELAKKLTLDDVFKTVKDVWRGFNDMPEENLSLLAADTIFSYFQDRIGMTHYLFLVGDNGSGKNSALSTFYYTGYRPVQFSSPTAPNLYKVLGSVERGQVTIAVDEANSIDESKIMMDVMKTGYKSDGRVARIDTSFGRLQQFYFTFSLKIFAAERAPDNQRSKGFMDRTFILKCHPGVPKYKIDKVINPAGNINYQRLLDELQSLRKLLLLYRMIHYNDPLPDVKLNVEGRLDDLCSPLIRLFQNASVFEEIADVLSKFIEEKQVRKASTLEAFLCNLASDLVESQASYQLESELVWNTVKKTLPGETIPGSSQSYKSYEYGTISQRYIVGILRDRFGAILGSNGRRRLVTFEKDRLARMKQLYRADTDKVRIIKEQSTLDASDASYAFLKQGGILRMTSDSPEPENSPKHEAEVHAAPLNKASEA